MGFASNEVSIANGVPTEMVLFCVSFDLITDTKCHKQAARTGCGRKTAAWKVTRLVALPIFGDLPQNVVRRVCSRGFSRAAAASMWRDDCEEEMNQPDSAGVPTTLRGQVLLNASVLYLPQPKPIGLI